ncbi:helix-turn-helix domain-containing protein [Arcanobacterium canis]|uniref:Helix-turn-helix transcriptional regulator n=1 Tax=Arcanobacterium canis TaxID=999183 RepID=A0ABY8FZQ0_9ACTO|nr:helix-turn-helix transcriptional regulator [Arcanobacterium canis]WFM83687.1 helix-turn-helix transcriptional regulator [Arcanobacterium canis]
MVWSNEEAEQLGQALRVARAERGFSQEKLAFTAGITKNQMQLLEAGRASGRKGETGSSNPRMATIYGLAKALDLTVAELFTRAGL